MPRHGKHASPGEAKWWLWNELSVREPSDECWTDWPFGRGSDGRPYAGSVRAYRLILTWRDGPAEGRHALHSCDNPPCWNPRHLRWGTPAENVQEAYDRNRIPAVKNFPRGERHHNAVLTDDIVREVLTRHWHGESEAALAREFGISRSTIMSIRHGKTWTHVDAPRRTGDLRGRNQFTERSA